MKELIALSVLLVFSQTLVSAEPCQTHGAYCVGPAIFDCLNGQSNFVKRCPGDCEDGKCIEVSIEPAVYFSEVPETKTDENDLIIYMSISIAVVAIIVLFLRLRYQPPTRTRDRSKKSKTLPAAKKSKKK